jgi:hypothetical protein
LICFNNPFFSSSTMVNIVFEWFNSKPKLCIFKLKLWPKMNKW